MPLPYSMPLGACTSVSAFAGYHVLLGSFAHTFTCSPPAVLPRSALPRRYGYLGCLRSLTRCVISLRSVAFTLARTSACPLSRSATYRSAAFCFLHTTTFTCAADASRSFRAAFATRLPRLPRLLLPTYLLRRSPYGSPATRSCRLVLFLVATFPLLLTFTPRLVYSSAAGPLSLCQIRSRSTAHCTANIRSPFTILRIFHPLPP